MNAGSAWLTYIIILVVVFFISLLILRGCGGGCHSWCNPCLLCTAALIASVIALLSMLILSDGVCYDRYDKQRQNDFLWYRILVIVALILPIIFLLLGICRCGYGEILYGMSHENDLKTSTVINCDDNGCKPVYQKVKLGNDKVEVYSR